MAGATVSGALRLAKIVLTPCCCDFSGVRNVVAETGVAK
jgi:hypothetical protein